MPRVGILNMLIGFLVIFLAAAGGTFVAFDTSQAFLHDKEILNSWEMLLTKSAHAHFNLFGYLHIFFALTMPYSLWSITTKKLQTVGLTLGTLAMGPGLLLRASTGVPRELDAVEIGLGILLACALLSLALHALGIAGRLLHRRS